MPEPYRGLNAALERNSGPSAEDVEKAALHSIWRKAAEKGIESGVDWPRVVLALFREIDRLAARAAAEQTGGA